MASILPSSSVFMNIIFMFLYVMVLLDHHQTGQANRFQMDLFGEPDSPFPVVEAPAPNSTSIDCGSACGVRCKLSSRPNLCLRTCGTCCKRCNCVPPGTYGHYEFCPCYFNQTTRGGVRKCP